MLKFVNLAVLLLCSLAFLSQPAPSFVLKWESNFLLGTHYHRNPNPVTYNLNYGNQWLTIYGVHASLPTMNLWSLSEGVREKDVQIYRGSNVSHVPGVGLRITTKRDVNPMLDNNMASVGGVLQFDNLGSGQWISKNYVSSCGLGDLSSTFSLNTNRKITSICKYIDANNFERLALTCFGGGLSLLESCSNDFGWVAKNGPINGTTLQNGFLSDLFVNTIAQMSNSSNLFLGTNNGIHLSSNYGLSWNLFINSSSSIEKMVSTTGVIKKIFVIRKEGQAFFIKENLSIQNTLFPSFNPATNKPYRINCADQYGNFLYVGCENGLYRCNLQDPNPPSFTFITNGNIKSITIHQNSIYIFNSSTNSILTSPTGAANSFIQNNSFISTLSNETLSKILKIDFVLDDFYLLTEDELFRKSSSSSGAISIYSSPPRNRLVDFIEFEGKIWLITSSDQYPLHHYSSGGIQGNFDNVGPDLNAHYGYLEARIRFDNTYGLFPAFWTWVQQGTSPGSLGWDYDEIDIVELVPGAYSHCPARNINNLGHNQFTSTSNLHTFFDDYLEETCSLSSTEDYGRVHLIEPSYTDFNNYGLEWSPNSIKWYFNGVLLREEKNPDMNLDLLTDITQPTNVILNQALSDFVRWDQNISYNPSSPDYMNYFINPQYSGPSDINSESSFMDVEYVRYYSPKILCSNKPEAGHFSLNNINLSQVDDYIYKTITTQGTSFNFNETKVSMKASQHITLQNNFYTINGKEYEFEIFNCY